jgi:hypothetical protein
LPALAVLAVLVPYLQRIVANLRGRREDNVKKLVIAKDD